MQKIKLAVIILVAVLLVIGLSYLVVESLKPRLAGLYVDTTPKSYVYINDKEVGQTPYRGVHNPESVVVKLVPGSFEKKYLSYETKTKLTAGVETVVRYNFAESEAEAQGDIVTFERDQSESTSLLAVSIPDSAIIITDGRIRAFAPYKTTTITPGEHTLKFTLEGYEERLVKVKIHKGFKLTVFVKLAKAGLTTKKPEEVIPTPIVVNDGREKVEILSNPMGYLRVRIEPISTADEIGRVNPGEQYAYLETDPTSGWYKIEYVPETAAEPAKVGWISNQYARKVSAANPTPLVTKTATPSASTVSPTPNSVINP